MKIIQLKLKNIILSFKNILLGLKNLIRVLTGGRRNIVLSFKIILLAFLVLFLGFSNYSFVLAQSFDTSVTIKPSLTLDISSDKISMDLDPASKAVDEQDLVVSIGTNNSYGYKLYVSTENSSTDLVNIADSTGLIPNLTSSYPLSTMPTNYWGYRLTNNSTTSSGDYGAFTSGSMISESNVPVNRSTVTLGFASKIDYLKPSGTYELTLNFKALPIITQYYMQELGTNPTLAEQVCTEDPTIVVDKRDERAYTIRRINGTCWMVENLRFTGTIMDSTTTNISSEYTPENPYIVNNATIFDGHNEYYDLASQGSGEGAKCSGTYFSSTESGSGNGYSLSCSYYGTNDSLSDENTVWYNYSAATAGTITGDVNTKNAQYDICPAGWQLPTQSEISKIGDGTDAYSQSFRPIVGGLYFNATLYNKSTNGYWWSSDTYDGSGVRRYYLSYRSTGTFVIGSGLGLRFSGAYIRCLLK